MTHIDWKERGKKVNGAVTVLNATNEPLTTVSIQRATVLQIIGKAEAVQTELGKFVRSEHLSLPLPKIIRLTRYVYIPWRAQLASFTRAGVLKRDAWTCQYCGKLATTMDHVLPRSRGGRTTWYNCVAACSECNRRKGNRTPEEANLKLRRKPFQPLRAQID
jgi:5-methylcytosine-specific restriction endonuclease McrA